MANADRMRGLLVAGDLPGLFVGAMGWDHPASAAPVVDAEGDLAAVAVADKRGVTAYWADCPGGLPLRAGQDRLVRALRRASRDQLVVFTSPEAHLWLWPEQRPSGVGYRLVAHRYPAGAPNDAILQRLRRATFTLAEEPHLTSAAVLERVRRSFNAEKVTRRFYKEFEKHHRAFAEQIQGIDDEADRRWYASLTLNRLMFCYFVQNKGFLDGDPAYLRSRLAAFAAGGGAGSFFTAVLLPLFHCGLGDRRQAYGDRRTAEAVGTVPFVNGGIFERHRLERDYVIDIPDAAFGALFDFFDGWRWHLDERPSGEANEINPDVLGYIFEQYINQKDYGAYYTKPDVTGYMAASAILPALADRFAAASLDDPALLLAGSGADYIHDSLAHGIDLPTRPAQPSPAQPSPAQPSPAQPVGVGPDLPPVGDLWPWQWRSGDPAEYVDLPPPGEDLALPGERWCDVVHRRERYARLLGMLSDSDRPWSIDDAVTENLDLPELLSDYLRSLPDAAECQRAFEVLASLTVCDPTVGSGAFLFAALDTLEPLYGTLLAAAEELEAKGRPTPDYWAEASQHPSEDYWALKTICLRNLYGVDIMAEAPEVAKLRLFLKLAAQIERVEDLEPLPDLDFNIKCGNLLVGVRDGNDAEQRIVPRDAGAPVGSVSFEASQRLDRITAVAAEIADAYDAFVVTQATHDHRGVAAAKRALLERSRSLRADCDDLLHGLREETAPLDQWVASHQPFHWFIEFPSIWRNGGFDVIIGNPPYIQTKKVKGYRWVGYKTASCPDLYAVCMERASTLLNSNGRFAMIVMHSLCFSRSFTDLRATVRRLLPRTWISSFARRPDSLFAGSAAVRNSIVIGARNPTPRLMVSRIRRWSPDQRMALFSDITYSACPRPLETAVSPPQWPYLDDHTLVAALLQLTKYSRNANLDLLRDSSYALGYKTTALYQLGVYVNEPPTVDPITRLPASTGSTRTGWLHFATEAERDISLIALAGRWGYLWWLTYSDEFHVTRGTLAAFPGDIERLAVRASQPGNRTPGDMELVMLLELSRLLQDEMPNHLAWMKKAGVDVGRYNMMKLRHITDRADWLLARAWGIEDAFEAAGNLRDRMIFGNRE